jgi:dynactin complex subunit
MAMISIFAIIYSVVHGTVFSSTCQTFQLNKDYFDVALIGHSVLEVNATNHHKCVRTCMSVTLCKSIDFNENGKICKLNDIDWSSSSPTEFESRKGSIFSDIYDWSDVSTLCFY